MLVMLPQFYEMDEGEEIKTLAVCNKLTRNVKLAKLFVDKNLKDVTASYFIGYKLLKRLLLTLFLFIFAMICYILNINRT